MNRIKPSTINANPHRIPEPQIYVFIRACSLYTRSVRMESLTVKISVLNLPDAYTCDGEDKSPEIDIGGVNTNLTKSLAILCIDPDSPKGGGFIHWLAWNIELVKLMPEKIPQTPEVAFPVKAVQGINSFGRIGYNGPCPPGDRRTGISLKYTGLIRYCPFPRVQTKIDSQKRWKAM